jgi:23S rRNA pseudouridine955/2504/2580 synthase/23S rRNA pseudouridine1911/1915/1917 synthase
MKVRELIILETGDFVALNKPAGLLSIPDREGKEVSLKSLLLETYGQVFTVHRLDKDTSGLILFARTEEMHRHLSQQFEERQTGKIYLGLVTGSPVPAKATINRPLAEHPVRKGTMVVHQRGKESITDYEVLEDYDIYAWLQFRIHTGRTHQIRVHMKDIGHPIACDPLYGDGKPVRVSALKHNFKLSKNEEEEKPILGRLGLHASHLEFQDLAGIVHQLDAPIPKDLRATLQQLQKRKKGR